MQALALGLVLTRHVLVDFIERGVCFFAAHCHVVLPYLGEMNAVRVRITVTLGCGHELIYWDKIEEKYPFWCGECEDYFRTGSYPWSLTAVVA